MLYWKERSRWEKISFVMRAAATAWITIPMLLLFTPLGPLLAIMLEDAAIRADMDNPYVDRWYWGWETVSLDDETDLRIPGRWSADCGDGKIFLRDESGDLAAWGIYGTEVNGWSWLQERDCDLIWVDSILPTNGVDFYAMDVSGEESYLIVFLDSWECEICLTFSWNDRSEDTYDIAQAISYAYRYA